MSYQLPCVYNPDTMTSHFPNWLNSHRSCVLSKHVFMYEVKPLNEYFDNNIVFSFYKALENAQIYFVDQLLIYIYYKYIY